MSTIVLKNPESIDVTSKAEVEYIKPAAIAIQRPAPVRRKNRYMVKSARIGARMKTIVTKSEGLAPVIKESKAISGVKG